MPHTKRGKGHPKRQTKKTENYNSGTRLRGSKARTPCVFTTKAWTLAGRVDSGRLLYTPDHHNNSVTPGRYSFFGLPPEIRNQILNYLLVPGEVDVKKSSHTETTFIPADGHTRRVILEARSSGRLKQFISPKSGLPFLATCRQAYAEGRTYYYGQNTFFLAPGGIRNTLDLAKAVQPRNLELIAYIGIKFDVTDLGPREYGSVLDACIGTGNINGARIDANTAGSVATRLLRVIWFGKLRWIYRHYWQSVREIHLESPRQTVIISIEDLRTRLHDIHMLGVHGYQVDREAGAFLRGANRVAKEAVSARFRTMEPRDMRRWIAAGCVINAGSE